MRRSAAPLLSLPTGTVSLNRRIYLEIRDRLSAGSLFAGQRLPSTRTLAADLGVSRNTALRAIEQLEADGWVETRPRSGIFAARLTSAVRNGVPDARGATPRHLDPKRRAYDLFPWASWARCVTKVSKEAARAGLNDCLGGEMALRDEVAVTVCSLRGIAAVGNQVFIIPDVSHALRLTELALGMGAVRFQADTQTLSQLADDNTTIHAYCDRPRPTFDVRSVRIGFLSDRATEFGKDEYLIEIDDLDLSLLTRKRLPARPSTGPTRLHLLNFGALLFEGCRLVVLVVPTGQVDAFAAAAAALTSPCLLAQRAFHIFLAGGHFARHLRSYRDMVEERRWVARSLLRERLGVLPSPGATLRWPHLRVPANRLELHKSNTGQFVRSEEFAAYPRAGILIGYAGYTPAEITSAAEAWSRAR